MKMLLLIMTLFNISAADHKEAISKNTPKKESRWEKLNKMIDKEENFIKTITNRGPRLQWRLLELKTERLKLIKEKENHTFLNAPFKQRKKYKKDWYFKKSRSYEREIRRKGLKIIKTWPRYKYNADIYYTLGLNSRDYNKGKQTEYFFLKALKFAESGSQVVYLSNVGLAEYYYNEKKYNKAVSYYLRVINNTDDQWHSKHLYNLSWCYLKTGKYQKAISFGEKAHSLSKNKDYIDVSEQVYDSIGLFYVMGKREKDGAYFYLNHVKEPAKYIIKMSKKMANEGHYKKANYLLQTALNHAVDKKQTIEEITIRLAYLDFYRNFKKFNLFFSMSQSLESIYKKTPFEGEQHEQTIEKIESMVGYLQVRLTRNSKIKIENYSIPLLKRVIDYFDILAVINKDKTDYYRFFQGETLFAVNEIKRAFFKYQASLEVNKKIDLKKKELKYDHKGLRKKLMNSLLACLEEQKFEDKHIIYTYNNHIELYPINPISQKLYSKLFNLHMKRKEPLLAIKPMNTYHKNYPADIKIQQSMLIKLIDYYILQKNTDQLASWINKMEKGFFKMKPDYIKQATNVLGEILFLDYTKLANQGKHQESIAGNKNLFEDKKYPAIIHAQAASKIALSYLQLGDSNEAVNWTITSIPLYRPKELKKRHPQLKASIERLVILQDIKYAIKLSTQLYQKYCLSNEPLKEYLFDQIFSLNLVEQKYKTAYKFISQKALKCGLNGKKKKESMISFINYVEQHKKEKLLTSLFSKYALKQGQYQNELVPIMIKRYWEQSLSKENNRDAKKTLYYLEKYRERYPNHKLSKDIFKITSFNKFKKQYEKKRFKMFSFGSSFDEEKFNNDLTAKFALLKKWVDETRPYTTNAPYPIVMKTLVMIHQKHLQLEKIIRKIKPPGMEGEYLVSFQAAMKGIADNISKTANDYHQQGKNVLTSSYERSVNNEYFLSASKTHHLMSIEFPTERYTLTFDQFWGNRKPAKITRKVK